jgi:hypothetical protein
VRVISVPCMYRPQHAAKFELLADWVRGCSRSKLVKVKVKTRSNQSSDLAL